jgi:peptide/nickel transport system permease protein
VSLKQYIVVRLILALPMLFILLTIIFFILRIMPGDPVLAVLGGKATKAVIDRLRHELGLDKPIIIQYGEYIVRLFKGDLGKSTFTERPIWHELMERFPATLELTVFSFIVALAIGVFWGAEAARRKDGPVDVSARMYAILMYAIPVFWLGLMMQLIFGVYFRILPIGSRLSASVNLKVITGFYVIDSIITGNWEALKDTLAHLTLPGVTLGLVISSIFLRMVRNNAVLMYSMDFVKAARARGIKEWVILYRHVLKNAFVPIMTVMGLQFALLLGGAVLTETTFSWPGMGSYLVQRIKYRDFPAIQGAVVFFAFMVIVISIIIDVINALVDPRVRY